MSKKINLTEKQLRKAINEISYDTVSNASSINNNLFWNLQNGTRDNDWEDGFDSFYRKLEDLEESFEYLEPNLYQNKNFNIYNPSKNNRYLNRIHFLMLKISDELSEIRGYADEVNKILERKQNQRDNFDDAIRNYDNAHENDDISWDEYGKGEINNV